MKSNGKTAVIRTKPFHINPTTFYSKVQSQLSETEAQKNNRKKKNRNKIQSTLAGGNILPIKNKGVAGTDQWESRQRVIST